MSGEQHIQFLCYGCRFFVTDWNKFWPFSEEITNGKNVLVTLRFYHGYQIYTYLAENFLWNWNTFHCHLSFLELNIFFPLAPVTCSNELFDVFCHPLPIVTLVTFCLVLFIPECPPVDSDCREPSGPECICLIFRCCFFGLVITFTHVSAKKMYS